MSSTDTATRITQVGTIIVPVSDQDAAIAFYTEKLGFEKRADIPFGKGDRWVEVGPAGHTTTLALMPPREGEAVGIATRVAFSTSDVDADHATLRERGVDVDDEVMRMGDPVPPMFWLRDPDNNSYLIVQSS
jgi:catechol 2,3-dioxygenase-like lactoylglutathione lyase family enzyme